MRFTKSLFAFVTALCLVLIGVMPLSSLYAQANTVTLIVTVPPSFADILSPKFLEEFETSHPGIKVQVTKQTPSITPAAQDLTKHFDSVRQYVETGDVIYVTTGTLSAEDTQAGYFLNMMPLFNDDKNLNPDDFYPAIWQSYQWDNGLWVLPTSADPYVLLYNPDAFDKAGIPYPNDQWTIDDLVDAARKLTITAPDGKLKPGIDVLTIIQPYAFRAISKTSIIDTSTIPNTPKFATPEVTDLMDKWLKLDNDGGVGTELGQAPMTIGPIIWLALRQQLFRGENRSAAMLPGGQSAISVNGFAISGGTQHPEQAYALAAWLTTRGEIATAGFASISARKSLKDAAGSESQAITLDVSPEVKGIIEQSLAKAIPLSEMRFVDYLALAYNKMKVEKVEVASALQQAEGEAVKAQQQAANEKEKVIASLSVATPVPSGVLDSGKVTLKFAISNTAPNIPNKDAWTKLIADFTATDPGVGNITLDGSTSALEKLALDYDCFYLPYNGLAPEKLAKLLPLDPLTSADSTFDSADMVAGVMAQVTRDNKIYALPSDIAPEVLKYDNKQFELAGVPAPSLTWTTDQFADALQQLKTFNGDKPAFIPVNTFGSYLMNLIVSYGGLPIDYRTDPPIINFTDPATVDAIRQVAELSKKGYFKYHTLFGSQLDFVLAPEPSLLKTGTLSAYSFAAFFGGSNDKLKAALYPHGSKYTPISYNLGTLYISAGSQNAEGCYRWINAVSKNPNLFGGMPTRMSLINDSALAAAQGDDVVAVYKQIATLLQDPNTIPLPAFNMGASVSNFVLQLELFKAVDKYLAENSSVDLESVLKEAESGAQAFQGCAVSIPPQDATSPETQKAYFRGIKQCASTADADLAPFFAGIKTD